MVNSLKTRLSHIFISNLKLPDIYSLLRCGSKLIIGKVTFGVERFNADFLVQRQLFQVNINAVDSGFKRKVYQKSHFLQLIEHLRISDFYLNVFLVFIPQNEHFNSWVLGWTFKIDLVLLLKQRDGPMADDFADFLS